ncbi:unnamed protein product [Kuraishia capsulata CBS 1993]|uniref:RING-type domain-containing protein n=1 Tax=Kuraishia capsulata CBS 1993 TaxID=1382522 RepID=W6MHI2_9ASCO|nr:uncharacterized protein KUCA_T00001120001 [Kuraishia capsulata CBS 1993]CDK25153.1 unnamed protein product [Kuraishia capsulata CBS 1993]
MADEMDIDGEYWRLKQSGGPQRHMTNKLAAPVETDTTSTTGKPERKRFEVKKWNAVAFWSWDMEVEQCAICRNHLMEPCIDCAPNSINQPNQECVTAWGTCNHGFHLHCIQRWTSTRNVCPLDSNPWVLARYGR